MRTNYRDQRDLEVLEITIRRDGTILVHHLTADHSGFAGTHYVSLVFDPIASTLTIKPSVDRFEAPWKACSQKSGSVLILARELLDRIGFPYPDGSTILPVEWNAANGSIVAELRFQSPSKRYCATMMMTEADDLLTTEPTIGR